MSLCLALLLAAIAINWWNGWKPFHIHPNAEEPMAKTAFDHSQQASAIDLMPPDRSSTREAAEHPPRRFSPQAGRCASETCPRPPFECMALLLQGGGALGGIRPVMSIDQADLHPDWIAGVSIGAINAA